jgi:hypothetical protein
VQFLRAHTRPGEHVLLLMDLGHEVARQAGLVNVMPFDNPITMVLASQVRLAVDFLRADHGVRIFAATSQTAGGLNALGQPKAALIRRLGYVPVVTDPVSQLTEWVPPGVSASG